MSPITDHERCRGTQLCQRGDQGVERGSESLHVMDQLRGAQYTGGDGTHEVKDNSSPWLKTVDFTPSIVYETTVSMLFDFIPDSV